MEIEQVDGLHPQGLAGLFRIANQVFRLPVFAPGGLSVGEIAEVTRLGGDQDFFTRTFPGLQGLTGELLRRLLLPAGLVVGPGGVNMAATGVQGGMDDLDGGSLAGVPFNGQPHGTQTDRRGVEWPDLPEQTIHHVLDFSFRFLEIYRS